jgi:5-methylcytosine-specific restriction enzyme subunit McrC
MIPIHNLYYLLCYAWNRLPERDALVSTSAAEFHRPLELLAQVLLTGTRRLLRQGLKNTYTELEQEVQALRGRLLLTPTLRRDLLRQGRAVCAYDELGPDSIFNSLLLGTIEQLIRSRLLPAAQRHELRLLRSRFPASLAPAPFTRYTFRQVRRQRLTGPESFLLNVCELIYHSALPEADANGRTRFRDFRRDERLMAQLFEAFVRNFYRHEQRQFRVLSETIAWQANADQSEDMALLPTMITDTTLESAQRKIILDTKYYATALRQRYDRQRLISPHLYQLYAYLQNQPLEADQKLEGILLYPAAMQAADLRYTLGGHPVRIVTLDLNQPWPGIAADLLGLIK